MFSLDTLKILNNKNDILQEYNLWISSIFLRYLLTFKSHYMKPVISAHRKIVSATLQILG